MFGTPMSQVAVAEAVLSSRVDSMRPVRWPALLLLALVVACDTPLAPVLPDDAQRFQPPPAYHLWWEMTLQCSGRRAPLSGVRWYLVPGAHTVEVNGERYAGYWSSAGNSIVLAEGAMLDGSLVRHEMLHALIKVGGHPREEFLGRCGGVVECVERCIADAEPLEPAHPTVSRVEPDALEVEALVSPEAPSRAQYGGYFTMTVTARNPRSHPVVVALPPSADAGPPLTFEYRVEFPGGYSRKNVRAWDDGVTRFAPGETKRYVFDFRMIDAYGIASNGGFGPGTYTFRGAYGNRWVATSRTITLSPP
jgi:hypothetical protein